ncbi:MAG TPA: hypothetical protein VFH51_06165, partial [Myxococcota bacterium]|nr:hypothetical protein [Myxococcota bacterium]
MPRWTSLAALWAAALTADCKCGREQRPDAGAIKEPRFIGRFVREAEGLRFAWSASTITARFRGTQVALLLDDVPPRASDDVGNIYDVILDDQPPQVVAVHGGQHRYPVVAKLADGPHTITVIKRTEPLVGEARFHGFDLTPGGELLPPPP